MRLDTGHAWPVKKWIERVYTLGNSCDSTRTQPWLLLLLLLWSCKLSKMVFGLAALRKFHNVKVPVYRVGGRVWFGTRSDRSHQGDIPRRVAAVATRGASPDVKTGTNIVTRGKCIRQRPFTSPTCAAHSEWTVETARDGRNFRTAIRCNYMGGSKGGRTLSRGSHPGERHCSVGWCNIAYYSEGKNSTIPLRIR